MTREYNIIKTMDIGTGAEVDEDTILMTRPDGLPAVVKKDLARQWAFNKGFTYGYSEEENREKQIYTRVLNEERFRALQKKQVDSDKAIEAKARAAAKKQVAEEFATVE